MRGDPAEFLPLAPAGLHILIALAADDLHGYAIMQAVKQRSEGKYKLGPGTLYDNLQKAIDQGLVQSLGSKPGDDAPRRRYYRLTPLGRATLGAEAARLEALARRAKLSLQMAKPRRA